VPHALTFSLDQAGGAFFLSSSWRQPEVLVLKSGVMSGLSAQGRMEIGLHVCSEAGVHGKVVKRVGKWWHVALTGNKRASSFITVIEKLR